MNMLSVAASLHYIVVVKPVLDLPLHTPSLTYTHTQICTCTYLPFRDILRRVDVCVVIYTN